MWLIALGWQNLPWKEKVHCDKFAPQENHACSNLILGFCQSIVPPVEASWWKPYLVPGQDYSYFQNSVKEKDHPFQPIVTQVQKLKIGNALEGDRSNLCTLHCKGLFTPHLGCFKILFDVKGFTSYRWHPAILSSLNLLPIWENSPLKWISFFSFEITHKTNLSTLLIILWERSKRARSSISVRASLQAQH